MQHAPDQRAPSVLEQTTNTAMAAVVAGLGVGVGVSLEDGILIEANDALLSLLGRSREDVLGGTLAALLCPTTVSGRCLHRPDGTHAWVQLTETTVGGQDGRPVMRLHTVLDLAALGTEQQVLRDRALRDPVTGLANRYVFEDHLAHALALRARTGTELSVVFIDLDGFKNVNDELGHLAGDEVLRQAGARIRSCAREADTVARWAGDEFAVLCEVTGSPHDADRLAARIVQSCAAPFVVDGATVQLSASVGVATSGPDLCDAAALLHLADRAMYLHKRTYGRATCQVRDAATKRALG